MSTSSASNIPFTRAAARQKTRSGELIRGKERQPLHALQSEAHSSRQLDELPIKAGDAPIPPARTTSGKATQAQTQTRPKLLTNTSFSSYLLSEFNVDSAQKDNPQYVAGYALDIYKYLHEREKRYVVAEDYISTVQQHSLSSSNRRTLVDYIVQVHHKFKLLPETLYLCVNFFDRFLSKVKISRGESQMVALGCLFLAMKYEEMYLPDTQEYVEICFGEEGSVDDLLDIERKVFQTLQFDISSPIAIEFLRRLTVISEADTMAHQLGKYLCELALLNYDLIKVPPSLIAAAATFLARHLEARIDTDFEEWNSSLEFHSGYVESDVRKVAKELGKQLIWCREKDVREKMVRKKYSSQKFGKIAARADVANFSEGDLP